jgi:hypothetical protein
MKGLGRFALGVSIDWFYDEEDNDRDVSNMTLGGRPPPPVMGLSTGCRADSRGSDYEPIDR